MCVYVCLYLQVLQSQIVCFVSTWNLSGTDAGVFRRGNQQWLDGWVISFKPICIVTFHNINFAYVLYAVF